MKSADLYIRVSTDEQADKGYSQRDQEERLRRYCEINLIKINKVIFEDHSAKTFNRPQWNKLLAEIKKTRGRRELILFTKWDRFSRNAGDAYMMISTLRKLSVEPQAVEQPLDLSIPENKMMLAFYLAAPEVENDRRALNTFYGMRRAKKEGRWMSTAPLGYKNRITPEGRKYIEPVEPQAGILKWVFTEIAKGNYATDQIRKMANRQGLKCARNNFWRLVRNPVYCGKIAIPQHNEEDFRIVRGQHEPLISDELFFDVQDVLSGRKRKSAIKPVSVDELPLRGLIHCSNCSRMLTGSKSKGKLQYYYYYHCVCVVRHNAQAANKTFLEQLREFRLNPGIAELFKAVTTKIYKSRTQQDLNGKRELMDEIEANCLKITKGRNLLLDGAIEADDYKALKAECEDKFRLEAGLAGFNAKPLIKIGIEPLVNKVVEIFSKVDELYLSADIKKKRHMVCLLFPEKLEFDGERYRTPRPNTITQLIYLINNGLSGNKNGKHAHLEYVSRMVAHRGIEPLLRNL